MKKIVQQVKDSKKISRKIFKEKIDKKINDDKLTEKELIRGIELDMNKITPTELEIRYKTENQILADLE